MNESQIYLLYAIGCLIFGAFCGFSAHKKGRNVTGFFFLGMLGGPLGVLISQLMLMDRDATNVAAANKGEMIKCPACAEPVRAEAKLCKHCRTNLTSRTETQNWGDTSTAGSQETPPALHPVHGPNEVPGVWHEGMMEPKPENMNQFLSNAPEMDVNVGKVSISSPVSISPEAKRKFYIGLFVVVMAAPIVITARLQWLKTQSQRFNANFANNVIVIEKWHEIILKEFYANKQENQGEIEYYKINHEREMQEALKSSDGPKKKEEMYNIVINNMRNIINIAIKINNERIAWHQGELSKNEKTREFAIKTYDQIYDKTEAITSDNGPLLGEMIDYTVRHGGTVDTGMSRYSLGKDKAARMQSTARNNVQTLNTYISIHQKEIDKQSAQIISLKRLLQQFNSQFASIDGINENTRLIFNTTLDRPPTTDTPQAMTEGKSGDMIEKLREYSAGTELNNALPTPDPNNIIVSVEPNTDSSGCKVRLQADALQPSELASRISSAVLLQALNSRKVFVRINEEVPYSFAVNVLDQIQVASERAKRDSLAQADKFLGSDGGSIKIILAVTKREARSEGQKSEELINLQRQLEEAQGRKLELERQQKAADQRLAEQRQKELKLAEQRQKELKLAELDLAARSSSKDVHSPPAPLPGPETARVVNQVPPVWPLRSLQLRWEADMDHFVRLKVFVGEQGQPLRVAVVEGVSGPFGFDEAAIDAANKSTYSPATRDGRPVKGWTSEIIYKFQKRR